VEKIQTHCLGEVHFLKKLCMCELMWKKCDRGRQATDVNITRCKRIGRCVTKDKDTKLRERASVLRYTYNSRPFRLELAFKHTFIVPNTCIYFHDSFQTG